MARHLLDSDVLIWILRGKQSVLEFLEFLLRDEVPAISSLSVYEIWAGARSKEEALIDEFLSAFEILEISPQIAKEGAHYYRDFRKKGITLSTTDALIAGTSKAHDLILVTQNTKHFPMLDIEKKNFS